MSFLTEDHVDQHNTSIQAIRHAFLPHDDNNMTKSLCILIVATLAGCSTLRDLDPMDQGAAFEVREKSYDQVWLAAERAVGRQFKIVEINKLTGTIKAEIPPDNADWGEIVGVYVRPFANGSSHYTVRVQSLKRSLIQVQSPDRANHISSGIKAELGL